MARRPKPETAPPRRPEHGGAVLLTGAGGIGPAGPRGEAAGASLDVDRDLVVLIDSRTLVDVARRAILVEARDQILDGRRPDGGPQRPVSAATAAQPGRVSDKRGVASGHMADELRATPIVGDTRKAHSYIWVPPNRNVFVATEAKRGVRYLAIGPRHAEAAQRAIDEAVRAALAGRKVDPEQGAPTAAEEQGVTPRKAPADRGNAARRGWETRRQRAEEAARRSGA